MYVQYAHVTLRVLHETAAAMPHFVVYMYFVIIHFVTCSTFTLVNRCRRYSIYTVQPVLERTKLIRPHSHALHSSPDELWSIITIDSFAASDSKEVIGVEQVSDTVANRLNGLELRVELLDRCVEGSDAFSAGLDTNELTSRSIVLGGSRRNFTFLVARRSRMSNHGVSSDSNADDQESRSSRAGDSSHLPRGTRDQSTV